MAARAGGGAASAAVAGVAGLGHQTGFCFAFLEHPLEQHSHYKWLIDQFVEYAGINVTADRVRSDEPTEPQDVALLSEQDVAARALLASMEHGDREIIAHLIEDARMAAIHDLASFLDWGTTSGKMTLCVDGKEISGSPYASFHYDFVCRYEGDEWPDVD
ncbi:MAG: DUF6547 family protein [Pseudomonadota bacterium]